jgi:hypothetical protein
MNQVIYYHILVHENDVYTVITSALDVERHYIHTESLASLFKQVIGHL